jgi:C-terminal processing protease CtpA/Prc
MKVEGSKIGAEGVMDGVRVSKVMDWGPAHKSSVRVGDIIEKVSGYDVKGLSANFVQHLIKGPSGWIIFLSSSAVTSCPNFIFQGRRSQ